ncbi:hypothetical protein V6667_01140 [Neisseria leonii]|uniref:Uncharacterized protein n=1 Tax=Neisseria leonii TaxID=2995413 RepID=A0A9X4IEH1_9NEIS|nr:hypothetical protein [Neisseria sp. 51.81]MDD9328766.1 hypothetical protein [Neisseria sp. 51.81]
MLLCSRDRASYGSLLKENAHAQFVPFDFSRESDYQSLEEQVIHREERLQFLVWVHSPYYPYLSKFLMRLKKFIDIVYLVKGSNSHSLPLKLTQELPLKFIQLGVHPTENRWLTNHEISQQVLDAMLEKKKSFG